MFVWGNHDYRDASYQRGKAVSEDDKRNHILYNKDTAWKMVTGEEKMPGEVFIRKSHGLTESAVGTCHLQGKYAKIDKLYGDPGGSDRGVNVGF